MSLFEIRQYSVYPGRMDDWIAFMETEVAPFMTARGMVIPAMFRGEEDDNLHIWIRRFDDEAHRERLYEAVYGSQDWQDNYKLRVREFVDVEKTIVHRVVGTPHSVMR
jgi:hypothetical protein